MKKYLRFLIALLLCPIIVKADVYAPSLGERLITSDITVLFISGIILIIIYLVSKNKKGKKK